MVTNASIGTPRAGDSVATMPMMDFKATGQPDMVLAVPESARAIAKAKRISNFGAIRAEGSQARATKGKAPLTASRFSKVGLGKRVINEARIGHARLTTLRFTGIGISAIRTTPESVKRPLRIALVRVVRTVVAVPGGRRMVLSVQRRMPETSSWLLRRYVAYRQMSIGQDMESCKLAMGFLEDFSRDESLYLRRIETALRPARER